MGKRPAVKGVKPIVPRYNLVFRRQRKLVENCRRSRGPKCGLLTSWFLINANSFVPKNASVVLKRLRALGIATCPLFFVWTDPFLSTGFPAPAAAPGVS